MSTRARSTLALFVAATALMAACSRVQPTAAFSHVGITQPETVQVGVRGTRLATVLAGQGQGVVFVHGSVGQFSSFEPQLQSFSRQYRVVTFSRRFHAPNDAPVSGARYVMAEHAEDLAALIRALGVAPAHIIGSSYGAYTSLYMALRHPELVRSLVLGEPPLIEGFTRGSKVDSVVQDFRSNVIDSVRAGFARGDSMAAVRHFVEGVSRRPGSFDSMPPANRARFLTNLPELRAEMQTATQLYMPAVTCEDLRGLRVPTLIVTGELTAPVFRAVNQRVRECMPGAESATIPRAGHVVMANRAVFDSVVMAFLARHSRRP